MAMVDTERSTSVRRVGSHSSSPPAALCVSVTQDMLNDLLALAVGEGRPVEPMEQKMTLPAMGDVTLRLTLTITGGRVDLRGDDDNLLRTIVTGAGDVSVATSDFDGDTEAVGPLGLPAPPAPIPVKVEALLHPTVQLAPDHTVTVGLDLSAAHLVSLGVDTDAPTPPGVDEATWTAMTQMIGMMFTTMGEGLWAGLVDHVGTMDVELDAEVGDVLSRLGVADGPAVISVASGLVTVTSPGNGTVRDSGPCRSRSRGSAWASPWHRPRSTS